MGAEEEALTKAEQRITSAIDEIKKMGGDDQRMERYYEAVRERDAIHYRIQQMNRMAAMQTVGPKSAQLLQERWGSAFSQAAYEQQQIVSGAQQQQQLQNAYANALHQASQIRYNQRPQVLSTPVVKEKRVKNRVLVPCFVEIEVTDGGLLNHAPHITLRMHPRWIDRMQKVLGNLMSAMLKPEVGVRPLVVASPDEMVALDGLMIGNLTEAEVKQPEPEVQEVEITHTHAFQASFGTLEVNDPYTYLAAPGTVYHPDGTVERPDSEVYFTAGNTGGKTGVFNGASWSSLLKWMKVFP